MFENILWFLIFGALFFFMMRKGGCGMHAHGGHQHGGGAGHAGHGGDEPGALTGSETDVRDPVCGMALNERDAAGASKHGGVTYHFCSARCQRQFLDDPTRYAG